MPKRDEDAGTTSEAGASATPDQVTVRRSGVSTADSCDPDLLAQVADAVYEYFDDGPPATQGP